MFATFSLLVVISLALQRCDAAVLAEEYMDNRVLRIHLDGSSRQRAYVIFKLFGPRSGCCDVWRITPDIESRIDVMLKPTDVDEFEADLKNNNIKSEMFITNVYPPCHSSIPPIIETEEISNYLHSLAKNYTAADVLRLGTLAQGSPLEGVKVSFSKNNKKRAILITAHFQSRAWESIYVVLHLLTQVLLDGEQQQGDGAILRQYDWVFIPNLNPDDLIITVTKDRLRVETSPIRNRHCLNRQYNGKCHELNIKTKSYYKFLQRNKGIFIAAIVVMSYGQEIYYPQQPLQTKRFAVEYGNEMIAAMREAGGNYTLHEARSKSGNIINILKDEFKIPFPYLLYTSDVKNRGFCTDIEEGNRARKEAYEGILKLIRDLKSSDEYNKRGHA